MLQHRTVPSYIAPDRHSSDSPWKSRKVYWADAYAKFGARCSGATANLVTIRDRPKFSFGFGYGTETGDIFSFGYGRNREAQFRPTFGYGRNYDKVLA